MDNDVVMAWAWLPAAIGALGSLAGSWFNANQARKQYREQQDYNTPKMQMQRYKEAGLSPYLIYGQGNSGNMATPSPSYQVDPDVIGKGIGEYMNMRNFQLAQATGVQDLQNKATTYGILYQKKEQEEIKSMRMRSELYSDFPHMLDQVSEGLDNSVTPEGVKRGFRYKINELKRATSEANLDRIKAVLDGLKSKNAVEAIKAKYAQDYGMVGGDWTQGLGLLKSIPSMFKGARKIPANEKALIDSYRKFKGDQYKRDANRFLFEQLK